MQPDSDIDLFIVRPEAPGADDENRWVQQVDKLAHDGSRSTGNDVRVLEFSEAETGSGLADGDPVLSDIRDRGIRLAGSPDYLRQPVTAPGRKVRGG